MQSGELSLETDLQRTFILVPETIKKGASILYVKGAQLVDDRKETLRRGKSSLFYSFMGWL
jgi:hypothetical protein